MQEFPAKRIGIEVQKSALSDCDILFAEKESSGKDHCLELTDVLHLAKELSDKNNGGMHVVQIKNPSGQTLQGKG